MIEGSFTVIIRNYILRLVFFTGVLLVCLNYQDVLNAQSFKGSKTFFDANTTSFSRNGKLQVFEGDVVAVAGGIILTADRVQLSHKDQEVRAEGHVMFLTEDQILVGDRVSYYIKSRDFLCVNCTMRIGDLDTAKKISISILGFSPKEVHFEEQRALRLAEVNQKKKKLKFLYEQKPDSNYISKYALLLEQEQLIQRQESSSLAQMNKSKRDRYKIRRKYWEEVISKGYVGRSTSFFMIEGSKIEKVDTHRYTMERPFWTPCKCMDEPAPWGFAASSIEAELGGYADVYNPVLQIKGVPVLYFPYLRVPLKNKRQTGLLLPSISNRKSSGFMYSQPLFLNLGDNMDSTITGDYIAKRGGKLGIEYRYRYREFSGIDLRVDGLRDRKWLDAKKLRDDSLEYYRELGGEDLSVIESKLYYPSNNYRWSAVGNGLLFINPRLSLHLDLNAYSDHRYKDDLGVTGDIESAFDDYINVSFYNLSQLRLNYDSNNFFFAIGSDFADGNLTHKSYSGQQIPVYSSLYSKYYNLGIGFDHDIYFRIGVDNYLIRDKKDIGIDDIEFKGDGSWSGVNFSLLTPISNKGATTIDYFFRSDFRYITYKGLRDNHASVSSFNTGFNINLPLDGQMLFYKDDNDNQKIFKHYMDWILSYDVRPYVKWNGSYGTDYIDDTTTMYFATDKGKEVASSEISSSALMKRHHKIGLKTIQRWHLLEKTWKLESRDAAQSSKYDSYYDQARQEIASTLSYSNYQDVYDDEFLKWKIDRYRLFDSDRYNLLNLESSIYYDFILASERKSQKKHGKEDGSSYNESELAHPWSELYLTGNTSILDFKFYSDMYYNFYYKDFSSQTFSVYLPVIFKTSLSFKYQIGSEFSYLEKEGKFDTTNTYTTTVNLGSKVLSNIELFGYYSKKISEKNHADDDYELKTGFTYKPYTDCWSLSFLRWKKFGETDKNSEYILKISIYLMSEQRDLPFNLLGSL